MQINYTHVWRQGLVPHECCCSCPKYKSCWPVEEAHHQCCHMMQQPHSTGLQLSWHIRAIYFFLRYTHTHFIQCLVLRILVARPISIADIYVCLPILRQAKPDHSEAGMSQHTNWKHMSFKKSIFDNHFTVYIYLLLSIIYPMMRLKTWHTDK